MSAVQKSKNNFLIKFIFLYLAMDWVLLLDPEVVSSSSVLFFCELLLGTASKYEFFAFSHFAFDFFDEVDTGISKD